MNTGTDGEENDRSRERKNEELFVQYYAFMLATARKVLKQKADAEDVIQSLFFKLVDREFPPEVWKDPKGYLYRTVINACYDWKDSRKRRKEKQRVEELELTEPRSEHAHEKAADQLEHLLDGLDHDIAEIVMLHIDSGYSEAEIAAMKGGSRSRITMILTRAREKLRKIRRGGDGPPEKGSEDKEKYVRT
jgi:RNA polymerase sigma-70 factor (ECF subfamily)